MKKLLLATALLASSVPAIAQWTVNANGVGVEVDQYSNWLAVYSSAQGGVTLFQNISGKFPCRDGQEVVVKVEGQPVKFFKDVGQNNTCYMIPVSKAGRQFIHEQFVKKSHVTFGSTSFSAMGYTAVINEIEQMKNAL